MLHLLETRLEQGWNKSWKMCDLCTVVGNAAPADEVMIFAFYLHTERFSICPLRMFTEIAVLLDYPLHSLLQTALTPLPEIEQPFGGRET